MNAAYPVDRRCRVLLVDDDPDIHKLVARMLRSQPLELISELDGEHAVAVAQREDPDLILLDYEMPGANGLEVFRRLRSESDLASTPIVFVTGNDSHNVLTECFQAGSADYIRKPFCGPELRARVRSLLDRQLMLDQLEKLAFHDSLTGLANRASIRDLIQLAINRAQDGGCAILFLDFDRFKWVNDSLGHDVGDQLLEKIASRMRQAIQRHDLTNSASTRLTAARLGGDEFVVLLEDMADSNDALRIADRLLAVVSAPYYLAEQQVRCTASIGVVTIAPTYATPDEVLRDADTAMYEAKARGKGCCVPFDKSMHFEAQKRLSIANDLHGAIHNDELFLVYQPIVSLESGRATAFEALVRWQHPERGLVSPQDFLPTAEETGLIVPIGKWVLERACEDFATWQRTLGEAAPSGIHVNLSRKQLLLNDLFSTVKRTLDNHEMSPGQLHLEVTESEIMHDPQAAKATLGQLRQLGVKIDIDDFGTGHSSLSCLQELPIDVLKIDRSFVANIGRSRSFAALVHAVTNLGENLGLTTVAEGIETADQVAMLQTMDCDLGQGYLFAKPMTADEVPAYLGAAADPGFLPPAVRPVGELESELRTLNSVQHLLS